MIRGRWARGRIAILGVVLAVATGRAGAQVEIVYVVPGSHLDVGFTEPPERVREKRIATLDQAIDAAARDPEFRWTEEGAWAFDAWLGRHREDTERTLLVRRLLAGGQIAVGATWVNPHAALFPGSLNVLTFHIEELEREFGYRPPVAVVNDVPSCPEALADALAARGVRYLLVGANMAFTSALPEELAARPFWWETAKGSRVLVFVDPDGYTAAYTRWGIDPDCARFFAPDRFPRDRGPLETMESGVRAMVGGVAAPLDSTIVQHSFDNWDAGGAIKLPGFVRTWNQAGKKPQIRLSIPVEFFRHIEERFGDKLPVRRGEWGGDWETVRGQCPVWTWRLREAARSLGASSPREAKAAVATAMDHSFALGGGWPGYFTEEETLEHARQSEAFLARAVELALGEGAASRIPAPPDIPAEGPLPDTWREILAGEHSLARLRSGPLWLGPFVGEEGAALETPLECRADSRRLIVRASIDRRSVPDSGSRLVAVVLEFPLQAPAGEIRIAPAGSPSAREGRWLRGRAPPFVVAPEGLVVDGLARPLVVSSPFVFAWAVVPEPAGAGRSWLQGLVFRQTLRCELKGGEAKVFPFETLFPGEPAILDLWVELDSR
ncbi:MAG: hypothetical protein HY720_16395 [Planctomycetes bacterium]|nr:hypothetical protein [Planctomycetota bacterium]